MNLCLERYLPLNYKQFVNVDSKILINYTHIIDEEGYIHDILGYTLLNLQPENIKAILQQLGLLSLYEDKKNIALITILMYIIGKDINNKTKFFENIEQHITSNLPDYELGIKVLKAYGYIPLHEVNNGNNVIIMKLREQPTLTSAYFFAYNLIKLYPLHYEYGIHDFYYLFNKAYSNFLIEFTKKYPGGQAPDNLETMRSKFGIQNNNYTLYESIVFEPKVFNREEYNKLQKLSDKVNYFSEFTKEQLIVFFNSKPKDASSPMDAPINKMDIIMGLFAK